MSDVLIADDDVRTSRTIQWLLLGSGHSAHHVADGKAALSRLAGRRPDLLLLDWMMPDFGGPDVLREIRRNPRLADLPVVVYTALSDSATRNEARRLGVRDVIVKSGGWEALYPRLRAYLHRTRSESEAEPVVLNGTGEP